MENWIIGPQLIGFIFFLAGLITELFPPKSINPWYGYRTAASMKNQQAWNEANRFSARLFMKMGLTALAAGVLLTLIMDGAAVTANVLGWLQLALILITTLTIPLVGIYITEKHLKKMFDNKN